MELGAGRHHLAGLVASVLAEAEQLGEEPPEDVARFVAVALWVAGWQPVTRHDRRLVQDDAP